MAITKIHAIKSTLGKALAYIENPDKTDGQMLVSGYNCEPQTASIDFEMTAVLAHKARNLKRKRSRNLAYHLIQSFSPEDAVTPEQAHELGKKLAFEYTGGKYEYVVATHIDKGHIHNHIMINAVSFYDYKKLRTVPYRTARQIRDISDRLCMEAHLSVIDDPQKIGQLYPENAGKKKSVSNRTEIRKRLNFCLERATDCSQFLSMAKELEITPTIRGKHISYLLEGAGRAVRDNSLSDTDTFTYAGICARLSDNAHEQKYLRETITGILSSATGMADFADNLKVAGIETKVKKATGQVLYRAAVLDGAWVPEDALGSEFTSEGIEYALKNGKMQIAGDTENSLLDRYQKLTIQYPEVCTAAVKLSSRQILSAGKNGLVLQAHDDNGNPAKLMLLLCEESVQNVEVRNYTVENAQIEQGTTAAGTTAKNLKDRDGASFQVKSSNKKAAWTTTVPLYYEKNDVQTIQVDYTGNTSEETNVIWLSLYRFDTQNWEVVGTIPGSTEEVTRSFVLSGNGISAYISEEGDIQIRVYNSASKEFIRYTDCVSVTTVANSQSQQKVYTPTTFVEEYGSSEGQIEKLDHIDGQSMKFHSDNNRKSAVQFEFDTDIDIDTIGEVTFVVALKSKNGANTQNLSLKNVSTGKFAVVKTASSSDNYEMIRFTLDSLREIEQYIDANGKLTLRIYNSASSSVGDFTREIDFVQMSITYGRFTRFEVAQLSDVHELIGSENFKAIISEINSNIKPAFSIITGDISDHGTPAQYELYLQDKQLFDGQVYTTPGNHDVRWWNANGKRTFTNQVGPLYQSFTYGGVHFVLLDTTVNFELDGKIGKAQLQWLKSDLDSIPADMPVILFGHHPFKINNNVTARHELLSATKDSNVIAFMNGHVHYYGNVVEDGVPINYITYIKDNPNQDFVTIEFSENYYYIYKRKATDHSKELWLSGRMNNTRKLRMTITNITARDNTVDVAVQIENAPDGVKSVQARIDNYGPYTQLIKNEGGIWSGSIDTGLYTPELVAGTHFVGVEAFDNENKKWTEYKDYSTPSDNPTIKWVFETGDSIQSSATINEANVYVGSNDGNLYCIDRDTGSQKWCIQTGNFVISKPAITSEGKIVFGSGDEFVYCASADDGNIIWNTKLGGSVLSDPLTSEGRVFIGCGDGKIYCLNSASGEIVWEYQTDGLMRQRPILENGILYAFVRDTYIWYAIDASTGQLIWRGNANTDESLFVCGDVRPVIANGKLWCIDAQNTRPAYLSLDTGELAWTSTLEKVSSRGMTTNGSTVFYSSNSGRQITAFDAETNQVVWQKDLRYDNKDRDLQEMQIDSALVYNGTSLIHVAERGRITALNPDNGEILWCIDAAGYPERVFWSTPEATDGLVIATGIDGKVYAVEYTH